MLVEIKFNLDLGLIAYLLSGFGFGMAFYYMFYNNNRSDELDRKKHDIQVKKEWIRMLSEQKKNNPKWPTGWSK
jgi:uncharacterized membrane-anchored protein